MNTLSVVIPSFNRAEILLSTINLLFEQIRPADEIIIVDQTAYLPSDTMLAELTQLHEQKRIVFIQREQPSIPAAMNHGLLIATSDVVLFLDDDVKFAEDFLQQHLQALESHHYLGQVGQVLQPNQEVIQIPSSYQSSDGLKQDFDFPFNADQVSEIANCMAGNLCVRRDVAIAAGGFDENFVGVAYRFETEFCRRMIRHTDVPFYFIPQASLHHLQFQIGGTRAVANHLTSLSPAHSAGDYYYALLNGQGTGLVTYFLARLFKSVLAKFYLRRPWYVPVRLVAEVRGMLLAIKLHRSGPRLIKPLAHSATTVE